MIQAIFKITNTNHLPNNINGGNLTFYCDINSKGSELKNLIKNFFKNYDFSPDNFSIYSAVNSDALNDNETIADFVNKIHHNNIGAYYSIKLLFDNVHATN